MTTSQHDANISNQSELIATSAAKAVLDMRQMNHTVQLAGQHYSSVMRHAKHTGLKSVIKSLLDARRTNGLDDESFSELLEIILTSYMENEVASKVESLLSNRLMNIYAFGTGLKR